MGQEDGQGGGIVSPFFLNQSYSVLLLSNMLEYSISVENACPYICI